RINSPSLYRLSYRGIGRGAYTNCLGCPGQSNTARDARFMGLICVIFSILIVIPKLFAWNRFQFFWADSMPFEGMARQSPTFIFR
ncbi:MAG: hypothetical protein ACREUM_03820, partial [Nitrosospira sp.]